MLGRNHRLEDYPEMSEQIRVLLVDDSALALQGLKTILEEHRNIVIVGTARTPDDAITAVRRCEPNVVLLDVYVGSASGIDLCESIRRTFPHIAILFLTAYPDTAFLRSAIHAGAQGYVLKSCSSVDIARSVEIVSEGKAVIDPRLVSHVIAWIRNRAQFSRPQGMADCSRADYEVLSRIAAGKSNKEIAQELCATPTRISSRIQAIYKRLKISRRAEATSYFVRWKEKELCSVPNGTEVFRRSTGYRQ